MDSSLFENMHLTLPLAQNNEITLAQITRGFTVNEHPAKILPVKHTKNYRK
ncbi:hypothetical protein [Candidatus Nitrosocosmicus sp. SS]|uniref:hypothetical protein n=1 Tax=Candidatus Nitrosocosmicus agrestis TaxID=2563600 RepID=UPI0012B610B6|nr:hypothetical protein [Candidatus Nitrosocosmicus sp. SS]MDR4492705.1 hypothetical protein [Candidatus Nitrosocosmicus sp.]